MDAAGPRNTPRAAAADITERRDLHDSSDSTLPAEPIDAIEANEPIEPTDRNEPTEPIDKADPFDAMERNEPSDHRDNVERRGVAIRYSLARSCVVTTVDAPELVSPSDREPWPALP